jgi:hypothetical protein
MILVLVGFICGGAFEFHADLDFVRQVVEGFGLHQLGVVFAEGLVGVQPDAHAVIDGLAFESFLELGKEVVVAAVEVDQGSWPSSTSSPAGLVTR